MKNLYITVDESGTFASSEQYFVYAGYGVLGTDKFRSKIHKYLKVESEFGINTEVKASSIENVQRTRLLDVLSHQTGFALAITNKNLPASCFLNGTSKAIIRNDLLRNLIIDVIKTYDPQLIGKIIVIIDEQNLKFGLRDNLYVELYKVLISGYYNQNQFIKPLFTNQLAIEVTYVNSLDYPLVRGADILAYQTNQNLIRNDDVYTNLKIFKVL